MSWNFKGKTNESVDDSTQQRCFRRWYVDFKTTLQVVDDLFPCNVYDLSPGGAGIEMPDDQKLTVGTRLDFELQGYGKIPAEVRYEKDGYLGLMFLHDQDDALKVGRYLVAVEENRRGSERQEVRIETNIIVAGVETACIVRDISDGGACVMVDDTENFARGQQHSLYLPGTGFVPVTVERVDTREIGVMFPEKLRQLPASSQDSPLWQGAAQSAQNFAAFRARIHLRSRS